MKANFVRGEMVVEIANQRDRVRLGDVATREVGQPTIGTNRHEIAPKSHVRLAEFDALTGRLQNTAAAILSRQITAQN